MWFSKSRENWIKAWIPIICTFVAVLISLAAMIVTRQQMGQQVQIMKEQNQAFLQESNKTLRPRPLMTTTAPEEFSYNYALGDIEWTGMNFSCWQLPLRSTPVNSTRYDSVTAVLIAVENLPLTLTNIGQSPFYISKMVTWVLTPSQWHDSLRDSTIMVCQIADTVSEAEDYKTDLLVLKDSTTTLRPRAVIAVVPVREYESFRDSIGAISIYPYFYIQYRDPYDNVYDALYMLNYSFKIDVAPDSLGRQINRLIPQAVHVERHAWDILYRRDTADNRSKVHQSGGNMTSFELFSVVIGAVGLIGLGWYAFGTWKMAEATKLQGEVTSYPTVSAFCQAGPTPRQPFSHILTQIINTGRVHAYAKITLKAVLHVARTDQRIEFAAPSPYDGSIWPLSAGQRFDGHFTFHELITRALSPGDTLTLEGTIESLAYGSEGGYRQNPPVYYNWKESSKEWVANVPPELARLS